MIQMSEIQPHSHSLAGRLLRFLCRLVSVAILIGLAGSGYLLAFHPGFRDTVQGVVEGLDPVTAFEGRRSLTLLVLGTDEDRDNKKRITSSRSRSDTIILARFDFVNESVQMLSIPRDTRVRIPRTRGYQKINAAHAIGGADLAAETVDRLIGVEPDMTVVVDYDLLERAIDSLGGVRVDVDKRLKYDDNWGDLHIDLQPGFQTLNGKQALGFVRYRQSNKGSSDSDLIRIGRQQELVQGVKSRLKQPDAWVRLPAVLDTVRNGVDGTITYQQLVALAAFSRSVPSHRVEMHTLPVRAGGAYVYPERDEIRPLISELFPEAKTQTARR
jgi:polyisoprenyl-teichoic acid--peptidoglycan teichoic acid transferase